MEEARFFLCFFPPNMTNFIQPIDAGLGRSVRIKIGHYLDKWLMSAGNMECWESKMTASERRIVTSLFISKAMKDIMSEDYDAMRVRRFEKTGCLITWLPNEQYDEKILPQGMEKGMFQVPKSRSLPNVVGNELPEPMNPEVAATVEEQNILDKIDGGSNMELDDGTIIDDNPDSKKSEITIPNQNLYSGIKRVVLVRLILLIFELLLLLLLLL